MLFILRPLLWATIEYSLALIVLKKGKYYPNTIAGILFFLGSYQLGEFVLFAAELDYGLQFSLAATTLLPPLGVLLISKHLRGLRLGYGPLQVLALIFAAIFLLNPGIIVLTEQRHCLAKLASPEVNWDNITYSWYFYYVGTLTYSMVVLVWAFFQKKYRPQREVTAWMFVAYASFFPASYFILKVIGEGLDWLASFMCALALVMAVIITWISLSTKPHKAA